MRLAWWRGAIAGERQDEAAGNPVALALSAAIDGFALPRAWLEAMLDARLQEIAPQDDFSLAAFRAFADESEGARLRLAALIAAGGVELDQADAHAPAGMALALTRLIGELPFKAGSAQALIPADVAARHGASGSDFGARRASAGVIAACAELRGLARDELAEAERRLNGSAPTILPSVSIVSSCNLVRSSKPYSSTGVATHSAGRSRSASSAPRLSNLLIAMKSATSSISIFSSCDGAPNSGVMT